MTKDDILHFFETHKAITLTVFCKEAGIHINTVWDILNKGSNPTQKTINKLLPTMEKYGYKISNK